VKLGGSALKTSVFPQKIVLQEKLDFTIIYPLCQSVELYFLYIFFLSFLSRFFSAKSTEVTLV